MKSSAKIVLLTAATVLCLVPFAGKAFHIDDPLFVWSAKRIVEHPLDPYGFDVNWSLSEQKMWEVTKNPPLASYGIRAASAIVGWSETGLHLALLLPAIAVVLGTYRLASQTCPFPLLAGLATLAAPVFLVSSSNVMCDTAMLAFWVWSVALWREGLERDDAVRLAAAAVLVAACAVTKYFGAALIPLLLAYSLARRRRVGAWAAYLLLPVFVLVAYQGWTHSLYGRGLLLDAAAFATEWNTRHTVPLPKKALIGLAFTGGCLLPGLTFAPAVWSRRALVGGALAAIGAGVAGASYLLPSRLDDLALLLGVQLGLFVVGGLSVIALAGADLRRRRDADSLLIALWTLGTFFFAAFVNWTVNGRSVLPMVPALAILLARRFDADRVRQAPWRIAVPLAVSAAVAIGVTAGDARMANAQRSAAAIVEAETRDLDGSVYFQGHWGFHYYMEAVGARPMDARKAVVRPGDVVVVPGNNTRVQGVPQKLARSSKTIETGGPGWVTTMNRKRGAGFYSSGYGPLPYAFGRGLAERYRIVVLGRR